MTNKIPETEFDICKNLPIPLWIRITQWFHSAVSFAQDSLFKIKTRVSWVMNDGKVDFWKPNPKVKYCSENFKDLIQEHPKIVVDSDRF